MDNLETKYEWDESAKICVAKAVDKNNGRVVESLKADISGGKLNIEFYNQSYKFSKQNVENFLDEMLRIRLENQ